MENKGFTFVEMILVMAVVVILIGLFSFSAFGSSQRATFTDAVDTLVSDMRSQQTKAMTGVTDGGVVPVGFGIHFDTAQYVLFAGGAYNPAAPTNSKITLPSSVTVGSVAFSGGNVLFASMSGEVMNYAPGSDSVTLINGQNNEQKTIQVNRYGAVIAGQ